jgi:hypothetical protein
MPMTIESGPARCSTWLLRKPTSCIQARVGVEYLEIVLVVLHPVLRASGSQTLRQ